MYDFKTYRQVQHPDWDPTVFDSVTDQRRQEQVNEADHEDFDEAFARWLRMAENIEGPHHAVITDTRGSGKGRTFRWAKNRLWRDYGTHPRDATVVAPDAARELIDEAFHDDEVTP